jgi:hypothetical protein
MSISNHDQSILRELGKQVAEIAHLPIQQETIAGWKAINDLQASRPMVMLEEVPWHEMNVDDELTIQTTDPLAQELETHLRRILYQWNHMRWDMVVEDVVYSPLLVENTGFGLAIEEQTRQSDCNNPIVSHGYQAQIQSEADVEKITDPILTYNADATEKRYETLQEIFHDVLQVQKRGIIFIWTAPWDILVSWYGVQQALMDMMMKPDLIHKAIGCLVDAHLVYLDQLEALNLLALNACNTRIGSGGYSYTQDLPQPDYNPEYIRAIDTWGSSTAQIFSDVSEAMHQEFALDYERKWLDRFGLTYYGCCEPLHRKIGMLETIPNLRKVSMSPWVNIEAAASIGRKWVFSRKPNPATVAASTWEPDAIRKEITYLLEHTRKCSVEIILKDISTVNYKPQRLWEWMDITRDVINNYY